MKHINLIGDAWVGGMRDPMGLIVPLWNELSQAWPDEVIVPRDFSGKGGLRGVLKRTADFGLLDEPFYEPGNLSVVMLGVEDAIQSARPADWIGGYQLLVKTLARTGPVFAIQTPACEPKKAGHPPRNIVRWSRRIPGLALKACQAIHLDEGGPIFTSDALADRSYERADGVWLRPASLAALAQDVADIVKSVHLPVE